MTDRRQVLRCLAALPVALAARPARAEAAAVFAVGGRAIGGIDPLGYFVEGRAIAGDPGIALMWRGALWLFATGEHRDRFEMAPAQWAPRFGGYCAYSLAQGALAGTDPEAWAVHEGKLYLMHDGAARAAWSRDAAAHLAAAEAHWPAILGG